jgi:hypothetical protein
MGMLTVVMAALAMTMGMKARCGEAKGGYDDHSCDNGDPLPAFCEIHDLSPFIRVRNLRPLNFLKIPTAQRS